VATPVAAHCPDAMRRATVAVGAVVLLVTLAAAPAAAVGPPGDAGGPTDERANADARPSGDAGPPGFVADLVPDFLGGLSVPNVVKSFVSAPTC